MNTLPSANVLESKKQLVVDLTEKLKSATSGVLVDYKGISVADDTALRKEFREAGVEYAVVKNTMLKFAAQNAGLEGLESYLEGTTALAFSTSDAVAPAKVAVKYADKIKKGFDIKAGFMDGQVLNAAKMTEVGKLPSKEQLIGQLLSVLTGNIRGMAVALNAIAEQKESA
ncbi:50S ribosomal protein L10 [Paludicola sp. MB14-C6]|uniref:50S ribosomal protein L10 n=1 Tax=Paludihabitans sp. MB14-C6 TaxID=3070656 RepID=UPI0027DE7568|nr:50S ribosomal protein L10 [Paludicola sp. MB14-C6]WMJ24108.1 50S ribosomal protein L10 [Paludicola sp. MB14-C6]